MDKIFLIFIVFISNTVVFSQQVIYPLKKHPTSFAIIIDKITFEKTDSSVFAYRNAVENDGLSVYIIIKNWKSPDDVKNSILKLYNGNSNLEGVVFIGDIPIPMIMNAHHLTSSYKMNKATSYIGSSVASDRFYEDFNLKFRFVKRDRENPLYYYYSLLPDSPQKIEKEIYSARIKPSENGTSKYEQISNYLFRVAAQKEQQNKLDNMMVFTGYGYHSEALTSWGDEQLALKEELPDLYKAGGRLKKLDYLMNKDMKDVVLSEIQNPDLDFAIFHAHGGNDAQYLLDDIKSTNFEDQVEAIKLSLREKLRSLKKSDDINRTKNYYSRYFGIPQTWFSGAFSDSVKTLDSLNNRFKTIYSNDIRSISPQAKLIYFDQCSVGSFQLGSYIAGDYVFGTGNVIAAIANSAETLQDQWTDEYIGLLSYGLRIGQLHKMNVLLESHLIGDPTFHFTNTHSIDISRAVSTEKSNILYWYNLFHSDSVPLKVLGLKMLCKIIGASFESELVKIYNNEDSFDVRLEALKNLAEFNTVSFEDILEKSINDPFEYIRRVSAIWMGKVGKKEYLPIMAKQLMTDESERVVFNLKRSMIFIDPEAAYQECLNYLDKMPNIANKIALKEIFKISLLYSGKELKEEVLSSIKNDTLRIRKKNKRSKNISEL